MDGKSFLSKGKLQLLLLWHFFQMTIYADSMEEIIPKYQDLSKGKTSNIFFI